MRICIVFNPAARGEKAAAFREHLGELSAQCILRPTYEAGSGRILAAEAVREGVELIVAAGGDGTVNEVINGVGDVPDGFSRVSLGVLPLGTVNVFAKELGLPRGFAPAWRVVREGNERLIDLPWAEYLENGAPKRRYFAQLAGSGLDSRSIELVNWEWKKRIGPMAYVLAGFRGLNERQPTLTANGHREKACGELVLIGNGRFFGGRFILFPSAHLDDGLLDVTVFPKVNWFNLFRSGLGMLFNRVCSAAETITFQTPTLTLTCDQRRWFELDGENVGTVPASFSLIPKALRVRVA